MSIPTKRFVEGILDWQRDWFFAFDEGVARFSILEIHRRGRKTTAAVNLLVRECCRHPNRSYVYIAPTYTQASAIVWEDPNMLASALPDQDEMGWKRNEAKMQVKFANGSILRVFGGDDPDRLRGVDADGVVIDEWAMCKPIIYDEIFRPIIAQKKDRWVAFLYTPKGLNHATLMFDAAARLELGHGLPENGCPPMMMDEWYCARVTADKSGIIPPDELVRAKKEMPRTLYDQELQCARITEEESVLITTKMMEALPREVRVYPETSRVISCDPSMGGDACVSKAFHGTHELETLTLRTRDTMRIVGELILMGRRHHVNTYIIDSIGIGRGICDRLQEENKNVIEFCSSARSKSRNKNLRAEMWWEVREAVSRFEVEYPKCKETRRQIPFASRYKPVSDGGVQIISKDIIKKELGCSPDHAEAWVMGVYAVLQDYIEPQDMDQLFEQKNTGVIIQDPMAWI